MPQEKVGGPGPSHKDPALFMRRGGSCYTSPTMSSYPVLGYALLVLAFVGIAAGRLPRLAMNRASIALTAAILLILAGGIGHEEAFRAIDMETIALLLAMMILVANLRLSGFFYLAGTKILSLAGSPKIFLAVVIIASGLMSALFLNDTVCIMLTPLVAETARRSGRDGKPYLIGLAAAANAGSCATAIGNPQNMLIASKSGISFFDFFASLAPPSAFAMLLCYVVTVAVFRKEFSDKALDRPPEGAVRSPAARWTRESVDRHLLRKSLVSAAILLVLLAFGVRTSLAALASAGFLLITRRTNPEKVFFEIDFSLLIFFSGLFILTSAVGRTPLFESFVRAALPSLKKPGALFAVSVTLISNIVSNVPAVMLLSPVARGFADSKTAWLMLAMASTFAGNLTLLGSVANLIVAEQGKKAGIHIRFLDYLKVGLPVTVASIAFGTAWLVFMRH